MTDKNDSGRHSERIELVYMLSVRRLLTRVRLEMAKVGICRFEDFNLGGALLVPAGSPFPY